MLRALSAPGHSIACVYTVENRVILPRQFGKEKQCILPVLVRSYRQLRSLKVPF